MTSQSATRSTTDLIDTARALIDAFNRHDIGIWERATAPGLVADYPGAAGLKKEAALQFNLVFVQAMPDLHFDVQRVFTDENVVVFQATAGGTFTGPMATPMGTVPPTGKHGETPFLLIAEVANGLIVREQTVWNQLEAFQQLGILPSA